MQRIKFKSFSVWKYRFTVLLFAVIMIGFGSGLFSTYSSGALVILGILIIMFEFSRFFWYKNFVQHNKNLIIIKLGTRFFKLIKFKDIKEVNVTSSKFKVKLKSNKKINFKLGWIERNDIDDLADILIENSDAEYKNEGMHENFYKDK